MLMERQTPRPDQTDLRVLITAEEAYPAMEEAFLAARTEIWAGYRVFDLSTRLRSKAARKIGEDWFDLIVHTLRRGVHLTFILSDFDPIIANELHCNAWKAKRAFIAAREAAGPDAQLCVVAAMHAARVGWLPRLALWPRLFKELGGHATRLNEATPSARARLLETSPGLRELLTEDDNGSLRARKFPPPPLIPATHHQKIAVFDRELLCIGGLDLDERRYDDKGHHRRRDETWHDVQVMCRGDVVADAQRHLETFLPAIAGHAPAAPEGALLTTLSRRRKFDLTHLSPRPIRSSLAKAHLDRIARSQRLIYLETQYFRDIGIARALARAARNNPALTLILVLPAAPEDVAFNHNTGSDARFGEFQQARAIDMVTKAFGNRAAICSPVRPVRGHGSGRDTLCGSPIIYVHAKVSIFDAERAIVSSANLNGRSLAWDTEAGILLDDPAAAAHLQKRAFRHWLGADAGPEMYDPETACTAWRVRARGNATLDPQDRDGFLVPHDVEPARLLGRRLPGLPDALV